ncbi:hypothetical protein [Burkholderia gladioli]|nr:hypothetical protein [Burkholderia gladioli]
MAQKPPALAPVLSVPLPLPVPVPVPVPLRPASIPVAHAMRRAD